VTSKRLTSLLTVLLAGFGMVFFLPKSRFNEPVGVRLALPQYLGKWYGVDQSISPREKEILAGDTEFARKLYTDGLGDEILASIVLSGHDLDNSIHRPERCLPAQGWTIANSGKVTIPVRNGSLQVTRLHNVQQFHTSDGKLTPVYNLNYYWFVGYHHMTSSHLERTFLDIQDRLLKGYNQRWAYVTIASNVTEGFVPFGRSESETDAMVQDFIQQLFPHLSLSAQEQASRKSGRRADFALR
jgi:EpsI family protein